MMTNQIKGYKMRKLLVIVLILFAAKLSAQDTINLNEKPKPLPAEEFVFPDYIQDNLENGLKLFIIEDHEQPTVGFRILIPGGSSLDREFPGLADMTASLMMKGAGGMSALQIAQKLDGVGANISISASADAIIINAYSLKKHLPLLLDMLSKIMLQPDFPDDELEKLKKQAIASIQYEKSEPRSVASKLAKVVVYGEGHPYSQYMTEESVEKITTDQIEEYYESYFLPNNASIAVIGDVEPGSIKNELNQYIGKWEQGKAPVISIPDPAPMPLGVYFIERPGSVQSTIIMTFSSVPYKNEDYEKIDLLATLMGGSFGSRLFRTLRETYSYTYSPYARNTSSKYANRFFLGSDVRNAVTDSAIIVIKEQLSDLAHHGPSEEELSRIKKYEVGKFKMAFEQSDFVSGLIQNADFKGINIARVKNYPDNTMKISPVQVMRTANKYIEPSKGYLVVVGAPEVAEKLEKFGKIYKYNLDLEPISGDKAKMEEASIDPDELIEEYVDAIGGEDALKAVKSMVMTGKAELISRGNTLSGELVVKKKTPNMKYEVIDMGMFKQEEWVNGEKAWSKAGNAMNETIGRDLLKSLHEARIFPVASLLEDNYTVEILGKQNGMILAKVLTPGAEESTYYFDSDSYLLKKIETITEGPKGPMPVTETFDDYQKVGEVMLPAKSKTVNPMFTVTVDQTYSLNQELDDTIFTPDQN